MRHKIKKLKFKHGHDANKMLIRKLAYNFLKSGKITTTITKAKVLKTYLERLLEKAKVINEANRNFLIRKLADQSMVNYLFKEVGPIIKDTTGGYVRIIKSRVRVSDGSLMAQVNWTKPIVTQKPTKERPIKKTISIKNKTHEDNSDNKTG